MNLLEASIESIQQAMDSGSLTAVQLTQYYLDRIAAYDQQGPGLNSIRVLNDDALKQAAALDDERSRQGARSMLHGIPILVKDNYETKGMPTTVGSVLFKGFAPDRDAHLVSKLKNAGALLLGKTNMQEFAYGITNVGSIHGFTRNPTIQQETPAAPAGVPEQPLQPILQSLDWGAIPVVRSAFLPLRIILLDYVGHKA